MVKHSYFAVDTLKANDIEQLVPIVGGHFIQKEPLAHSLDITQPEMDDFVRELLTESAKVEAGLVLRIRPEHCPNPSNNIIGYMIGTAYDYDFPEDVGSNLSPKVLSVFTLLEKLAEDSEIVTAPDETLMIHMLGVTFEFVEGLRSEDLQRFGSSFKPIWFSSMINYLASHPRFKGVAGQATNKGSRIYAEEAGWHKVGFLPYQDYACPVLDDKVFQTVPDGCTQFAFRFRD